MAPAGRKPIDPEKRRVKVNVAYTSVEGRYYNAIINEARATETNVTKQIEAAIVYYAKMLLRRKAPR